MKLVFNLSILGSIILTAGISNAQSLEEKARGLLETYKSAMVVLTVNGTVSASTDGGPLPSRDQQRRTLGITTSDNGLIAVSNSAIDSAVGLAGQQAQVDGKVVTIKEAVTEFKDIEISYGDGVFIRGKVVKQFVDADIAFILPDKAEVQKAGKVFQKVDLSRFDTQAGAADEVIGLSRASSVFGFMPTLMLGRITGIFKDKDSRVFYVNTAGNSQGMPIFTPDGRPVGLTVVRIVDGEVTGVLATLSAGLIAAMASQVEG